MFSSQSKLKIHKSLSLCNIIRVMCACVLCVCFMCVCERDCQLLRQRIMLILHVHLQCENSHTHTCTCTCMLQSSSVFQCEGSGGAGGLLLVPPLSFPWPQSAAGALPSWPSLRLPGLPRLPRCEGEVVEQCKLTTHTRAVAIVGLKLWRYKNVFPTMLFIYSMSRAVDIRSILPIKSAGHPSGNDHMNMLTCHWWRADLGLSVTHKHVALCILQKRLPTKSFSTAPGRICCICNFLATEVGHNSLPPCWAVA